MCLPASAGAETLADAIALAYQSNPTLQSARAQLRAIDEEYVQARAGYRPTIQAQAQPLLQSAQQPNFLGTVSNQWSNSGAAALEVRQPLFASGAIAWGVEAASDDIRVAREGLRTTEAQVLQAVVQAYVDVRRDQAIVAAFEGEVGILQKQLDDASARRQAGDITRTDVEQSQTQLESSRASLTLAQGQLQVSRAAYFDVVGQNPGTLEAPPPLPGLPTTIDEAFTTAQANNATLRQAQAQEHGNAARIAEAKAEYRPSVELSSSLGYQGPIVPFNIKQEERAFTISALVTIPLFTGGVAQSNVRKAVETDNSSRFNIEAARRSVVQQVSNAWNTALSNRFSAQADARAVATARKYFSDTEEEYRVGQRSTLDVLTAEQVLRAAEVAQAQAEHDSYLAEANLLAAVGRLEAADLVTNVPIYDPAAAFRRMRDRGSVPWEGAVEALDKLGATRIGPARPLDAPAISTGQALRPGPQIPDDAPMSTSEPEAPLPGTTSPKSPPGLGEDRGQPYAPAP
jgi:outer membrane protein